MAGRYDMEFFIAIRSLAFALPVKTFEHNLSRSSTFLKAVRSSSSSSKSSMRYSTASCRVLISEVSNRGRSSEALRNRPPMGVNVSSRTWRSVPSRELSLRL